MALLSRLLVGVRESEPLSRRPCLPAGRPLRPYRVPYQVPTSIHTKYPRVPVQSTSYTLMLLTPFRRYFSNKSSQPLAQSLDYTQSSQRQGPFIENCSRQMLTVLASCSVRSLRYCFLRGQGFHDRALPQICPPVI